MLWGLFSTSLNDIKKKKLRTFFSLSFFYILACALYFWPIIKYNGIHIIIKKAVEPFYRPFVVQWQNTRTKRTRDAVTTGLTNE